MALTNVILLLVIIFFPVCFIYLYRNELFKAFTVLVSGFQSILFVIFFILFRAVKASIIGAIVGCIGGGILKVAGAPLKIITAVAVTVGVVIFAVLTIKALIEEWNNLHWSMRNAVRNRYRQR